MKLQPQSDTRDRRQFIQASAWGAASLLASAKSASLAANPLQLIRSEGVKILLPRNRVPLSFIIDDSTCLVNMGHFCNPQFATAWPKRSEYQKPWRAWPREIPDTFVRRFGQWCMQHGVKGKYSIVPYPACVGWLDRELPGWSRTELQSSLKTVREWMVPHWDIHPEMLTHTRVIDLKTGRPMDEISSATMENSFPQRKISVDHLASYLAYALRILKNCDLPCEGITTPGGFGNAMKAELPIAVDQAVRDVYGVELPHYFKYVVSDDQSTEPRLEHLRNAGTDDVRVTVNVPAGTGDWFGGWQGDVLSEPDRYCNQDATSGRMVELIERRQPAVMLCHWPGMYSNGSEEGFDAFKRVVVSLASRFANETMWMKVSEIGRYWAAKELTQIESTDNGLNLKAPFATNDFTIEINGATGPVAIQQGEEQTMLQEVASPAALTAGTWHAKQQSIIACFNLPKGNSRVAFSATALLTKESNSR
ncbi:hypothetical protein [Rhodopirellula halodulae]|uniref:hypothetical protein n=1 Tax=Rhodopirellula halodulae TaxID=2894198 RepID=UPI001E61B1B6|nr:hypothetical protein [Rhodopirellula sp. JC737]MCC9656284.1 hypothetical protein [Rhodopirellula sp. JC737]